MNKGLKDIGMPEDEISELAVQCMKLPDYKGNPRVATNEEMVKLVEVISCSSTNFSISEASKLQDYIHRNEFLGVSCFQDMLFIILF